MSTRTQVITLSRANPGMTPSDIAALVGISAYEAKDIIDDDEHEIENDEYLETTEIMLKGLRVSEIQTAARHTGTLWGGDAE